MNISYLLFWLPMIVIAFLNATLRQMVFVRYMSELKANQLSTITLIIFCAIYIGLIIPLLKIQNSTQAFLVGSIWVVLTIIFEFAIGLLTKKSWTELLQQYNITQGHIWPIFLICLLILPYLFYQLKK